MSNYFRNFPVIEYNKFLAKNIMANVRLDAKTKQQTALYHPYAMKDGDNMRTIAGKYYNNEDLDWLVYFANDIIDPYYDVHISIGQFEQYINKKYGSQEIAKQLVTGWINDWQSDDGTIPVNVYDSLLPKLKKYYDPVIDLNRNLTGYTRAKNNTLTNTNRIIHWTISSSIDTSNTSLLSVYASGTNIGKCQVVSNANTSVLVQNVILSSNVSPTHVQLWNDATLVPISGVLHDYPAIPLDEVPFWRSISKYEAEYLVNDSKKNLSLVSSQFSGELSRQLKEKL